jgi:prephenate dehydrogenase
MDTATSKTTVGIVGLGSFGSFIAGLMPGTVRVLGYDRSGQRVDGVKEASFSEAARADIVILAVPLASLESTLQELRPHLRPESLVIDVCSVKVGPEELYIEHLPGHAHLLMTHPLFGPQSAATGTHGHRLIVTKAVGEISAKVLAFCKEQLGLDITHMSAEDHDKIMARVHALTFFVARGLSDMGLQDEIFMTPSYKMLMDLVRLDHSHSQELFRTIEQGNPYAKGERERLLRHFSEIEASLA